MQIWQQAKRATTKTPEHAGGGTRSWGTGGRLSAECWGFRCGPASGDDGRQGGYSVCHVHGGLQNLQRFACLAQRPLPLLLGMCVHFAVLC